MKILLQSFCYMGHNAGTVPDTLTYSFFRAAEKEAQYSKGYIPMTHFFL